MSSSKSRLASRCFILIGAATLLFSQSMLSKDALARNRRPQPQPAPAAQPAPAPIPNCADTSDFIRSGGAIPMKVPSNYSTVWLKGDDFRHEQPASGIYPWIPTHSDYSQKWKIGRAHV